VTFTVFGKTRDLGAGDLLHLSAGDPCKVRGIEDASLLLTVFRPRGRKGDHNSLSSEKPVIPHENADFYRQEVSRPSMSMIIIRRRSLKTLNWGCS
jgi:hypothetical protein